MELQPFQSIHLLKGLGPKTRDTLNAHGIRKMSDFLSVFPRAWINATMVTPIAEIRVEMPTLIEGYITAVKEGISQRTRLPYIRVTIADDSDSIDVMWFHARFLKNRLNAGTKLLLYGKIQGWKRENRIMMSPRFITDKSIIPIYPTIGGVTSNKLQKFIEELRPLIVSQNDWLPESIREQKQLMSRSECLSAMHFPQSITEINLAKERLAYDELLMLVVPSIVNKRDRVTLANPLHSESKSIQDWCDLLPFALTNDQQSAIATILSDLSSSTAMNRLLQGDVGSGKTVVGLAGALATLKNQKQVLWLAPTELLAEQHFATAKKLLGNTTPIGLWTRSNHTLWHEVEFPLKQEELGSIPFIIGTHALLSQAEQFNNLGLLVIDEQHRFGVNQRAQLRRVGGGMTHLLSMTATPIPRTMALLLYGDLDLTTITEKPPGRKPITTRLVTEQNREKAYDFLDASMKAGRQVYVVCSSIAPPEDEEGNVFADLFEKIEEKKAVTTHAEALKKRFPHHKLEVLHGKMKPTEKQSIMDSFRSGETNMLISTTVIEVGVDVPNATLMVIEDAERFGLAQLHQLRGRVGRGETQSFCLLFPSGKASDKAMERLKLMEETDNGFILAEKDLELRGPGELTGASQSGLPPLRFATLQDSQRLEEVRSIAEQLIDLPEFRSSYEEFWTQHHPE